MSVELNKKTGYISHQQNKKSPVAGNVFCDKKEQEKGKTELQSVGVYF